MSKVFEEGDWVRIIDDAHKNAKNDVFQVKKHHGSGMYELDKAHPPYQYGPSWLQAADEPKAKRTFEVLIEERRASIVEVEADDEEDAIQVAKKEYHALEHTLDSAEYIVDFDLSISRM